MAYRYGDRYQTQFFPPSIEEYVAKDDPVRVYDAFVNALDLKALGIKSDSSQPGCPAYNPSAMVKLMTYSYSYGWRASRKIERAEHHNISFIWLMGGLKPDHKTIARFRSDNKEALANILGQCARLCIKLNLIAGNTLFIDGSKIRANASIGATRTREKCEKELIAIDKRIQDILREAETIDNNEANDPSLVKIDEELKNQDVLKSKIENLLSEMKDQNKTKLNMTDPECCAFKSRQGKHAGYNAQIAVDDKHGFIVASDVVNENTDINQFSRQLDNANDVLDEPCKTACADAGYINYKELRGPVKKDITVIVPSTKQANDKEVNRFDKENFTYDETEDNYICPTGNKLIFRKERKDKNVRVYQTEKNGKICRACALYKECTNSKHGREIHRYCDEKFREQIAEQYKQPYGRAVYAKRKERVELPFGHIKRNLGAGHFLLRGIKGAKAEMSLLSSCFNVRRMITLMGVTALVEKLAG